MQGEQVRELQSHSCYIIILTTAQRYIVRDFQYSSDQIDKEREELQMADTAEKELWVSFPTERDQPRQVRSDQP